MTAFNNSFSLPSGGPSAAPSRASDTPTEVAPSATVFGGVSRAQTAVDIYDIPEFFAPGRLNNGDNIDRTTAIGIKHFLAAG